jgi:dihydroxy-acid dehydratase
MASKSVKQDPSKLRSRRWFANPDNPNMTALYLERYMNFGLKREELQAGKPIIGIAQSGSDLSPCNRHHLELAHRVREGIREAGGIAFEFPVHPIQETGKRPTAALDRNLCYLGLVETLYGYFIDGVVLTTGCDKTTPAQLMAAATVDIPAIVLSGGPMLNGWFRGERTGSGTIVWKARELLAAGEINDEEFIELIASSAPSVGHCNTMGTASTMNSLAEALGMSLPGGAAIPAPHKDRAVNAYESGKAHCRDGVGRPAPVEDHDPRSVRERDRRQLGDRRFDQRAYSLQRDRPPHRSATRQRRLGEDRVRHSATGEPPAGRRVLG